MPLCAYDSYKNRLGFGSGFYDRYIQNLRKTKNCVIIGAAYEVQGLAGEILPTDSNDQKVDYIVNEKGILE